MVDLFLCQACANSLVFYAKTCATSSVELLPDKLNPYIRSWEGKELTKGQL